MSERHPPPERAPRSVHRPQRRASRRSIKWSRVVFTAIAIVIILFMILSTFAPVVGPP
jgi:predicted anti-sigma-YlaC factor YlaD